eukprot:764425-Hanusia_phi.AAC.7
MTLMAMQRCPAAPKAAPTCSHLTRFLSFQPRPHHGVERMLFVCIWKDDSMVLRRHVALREQSVEGQEERRVELKREDWRGIREM